MFTLPQVRLLILIANKQFCSFFFVPPFDESVHLGVCTDPRQLHTQCGNHTVCHSGPGSVSRGKRLWQEALLMMSMTTRRPQMPNFFDFFKSFLFLLTFTRMLFLLIAVSLSPLRFSTLALLVFAASVSLCCSHEETKYVEGRQDGGLFGGWVWSLK